MSQTTTPPPLTLAQSIVWASVLSAVILFVSTAALTWAITGGLVDGIAVGIFSAFWGGAGFGVIAGGAAFSISSGRDEALLLQEEALRSRATGSKAGFLDVAHVLPAQQRLVANQGELVAR